MNESQELLDLIKTIRAKKLKIGFAESCTGGLLAATFASIGGVSDIFSGAVVPYSNELKKNLLKVSEASLKKHGAVSLEVVHEMAIGGKNLLGVDLIVAISGIAGPSGGSAEKPVGTVCFAILGPDIEIKEKKFFAGYRGEIQNQSVEFAISSLLNALR